MKFNKTIYVITIAPIIVSNIFTFKLGFFIFIFVTNAIDNNVITIINAHSFFVIIYVSGINIVEHVIGKPTKLSLSFEFTL